MIEGGVAVGVGVGAGVGDGAAVVHARAITIIAATASPKAGFMLTSI
jgi:hypothetical protein